MYTITFTKCKSIYYIAYLILKSGAHNKTLIILYYLSIIRVLKT